MAGSAATRFTDRLDEVERGVFRYWLGKRQDGAAPRRNAIDPADIRPWLPRLQIHLRTSDGRYLCRLTGTAIARALGVDSTGRHMDEIIAPAAYASRRAVFDRVLASGLPALYRARITVAGKEWKSYRRMLLPLRLAAATPDMMLSCVEFETRALTGDAKRLLELVEALPEELA